MTVIVILHKILQPIEPLPLYSRAVDRKKITAERGQLLTMNNRRRATLEEMMVRGILDSKSL